MGVFLTEVLPAIDEATQFGSVLVNNVTTY
jgi:hypothetical protein